MAEQKSNPSAELIEVITTLVEAIKDGGLMGVPAGHMYAMLMSKLSLEQFEKLMELTIATGMVRHSNHCYYYVKAAK